MNTLIRKLMAGVALLSLSAVVSLAGNWNANIASNQSYSGTAVIPTTSSGTATYTQYLACYLGATYCDGPYGPLQITYPQQPDSYDYANQTCPSGTSYPVYMSQSGSGYAGVDFTWM